MEERGCLKDYKTERVLIMNCSLDMAKSIILFREELTVRSPIEIPDDWPSDRFITFLPLLIEGLEKKIKPPFYLWILANITDKKMMGDILLYRLKSNHRTAFLEMHFISSQYEKTYYKETMKLFLDYVMSHFEQAISNVNVEILYTDTFKIDILKRLGFYLKRKEHPYLLWSFSLNK